VRGMERAAALTGRQPQALAIRAFYRLPKRQTGARAGAAAGGGGLRCRPRGPTQSGGTSGRPCAADTAR
jgi:hypothetical protein